MTIKCKWMVLLILLTVSILGLPVTAAAADAPAIDTGDTAFIIICTALVMIMTPGLHFFMGEWFEKRMY